MVSVKDVYVVEGFATVTGTEVVNVVKLELREREEEVALAGMGEEDVDVRVLEADVNGADDGEDAEGIAEDEEDGDEAVGEGAGEPVGRKVEPPLVVHHSLWAEMENMEVSSLAVRRSRVVEGMTEDVGGVVMYAQRAGIHRIQGSRGKSETQRNPGRRPSHNTNLLPHMAVLTHPSTRAS